VDEFLHYAISDKSLLGYVLSAATQRGLCAFFMGDSPRELVNDLEREFPNYLPMYSHRGPGDIAARLFNFAGSPAAGMGFTLDAGGTRLERRVWDVLRSIPIGQTTTYSEIARRIGVPSESYAVAQVCMRNRIALAIPCHRVASAGDIGDYRWGPARKRCTAQHRSSPVTCTAVCATTIVSSYAARRTAIRRGDDALGIVV
jgi:AraC family transcriptional regulator, regulatory protein of adaptative response / methylated-DNA-[protein]-cysteine methyltransferase